jgi:hypothetical protein
VALIEVTRVGGTPRHRYVAYLGSFTEQGIECVYQRCWFWDRVNERLHALPNPLTDEDRNRIIAEIASKVPVPTRAEHAQCHRDSRAMLKGFYMPPSHGLGIGLCHHPTRAAAARKN